jgi:hypothetical protein
VQTPQQNVKVPHILPSVIKRKKKYNWRRNPPSPHIRKWERESALKAAMTGELTKIASSFFFILLQLAVASAHTASVQAMNSDLHGH